jgi:CheY-like chemotaxis protein
MSSSPKPHCRVTLMNGERPTILVVEDDGDVNEAICSLLTEHGFATITVQNGADALAQLRAHPHVRAIVLDVMMPVMNGATFRGAQLEDPSIADIPLVLLTGRSDGKPLAQALNAAAFLQKPFDADALLGILSPYR